MGDYFLEGFRGIQERVGVIGDIRMKGLFMGVEVVADRETKKSIIPTGLTPEESRDPDKHPMVYMRDYCRDEGLRIGSSPGQGVFRMMPPWLSPRSRWTRASRSLRVRLLRQRRSSI